MAFSKYSLIVAACLMLAAFPARANDSTAELDTGGLDFIQNDNVEMRSEDLFVSTEQIRVTYHFFNKSDQPVTSLRRLPDAGHHDPDQDPTTSRCRLMTQMNFLHFTTTGKRAAGAGAGRAEGVRQGHRPHRDAAADGYSLGRRSFRPPMTRARRAAKGQMAIARSISVSPEAINTYGTGPTARMTDHLEPRWTLKTVYFWQQTFPAQQELVIEHQYKPSVGSSAPGSLIGTSLASDDKGYTAKPTVSMQALSPRRQKLQQAGQKAARTKYVSEQRIDYILKTGANWAGPIADFTLTVDKGKPDNLLSFCGTGVKKLSPTQFQVHYTNFTPKSDLGVLLLLPIKGSSASITPAVRRRMDLIVKNVRPVTAPDGAFAPSTPPPVLVALFRITVLLVASPP